MTARYCADVYKGLYVRPQSQSQVEIGFCCQSKTALVPVASIQNTLDHKRKLWQQQVWPTDCWNCWSIEKSKHSSRRHAINAWYQSSQVDLDTVPELISLDVNSTNICNLACISCGPIYSSRWAAESSKHSWTDRDPQRSRAQRLNYLDHIDLGKLQRVYFNGGEPLLAKDHIEVLQLLKTKNILHRCEVSYNTNCTVIPTPEVVDLWQQAGLVRLFLSVDAVGQAFDFIRWPATWQQVTAFLQWIHNLSFNVIIDITVTVGIHNVFEIEKLLEWQKKQLAVNHQGDAVTVNFQRVGLISHGGKVLSLANVSMETYQTVQCYLNKNLPNMTWLLPSHSGSQTDLWVQYLEELSVVRKKDWTTDLQQLYLAVSK